MINRDISYWRCLLREGIAVVVESPLMVQPVMYAVDSPYPQMPSDCLLSALIQWETITPGVVQAMLDSGADVNAKDKDGWTPLLWAAYNGNAEVISVLLQAGADVNAKKNNGDTPLLSAVLRENIELISVLLKRGADVNAKDDDGRTPLLSAVLRENIELISILIQAGADLNAKDNDGFTPLDLAEGGKHWAAAKALEDAIINTGKPNSHALLELGKKWKTITAAEVLAMINAGADVHAKNNDGNTPLHAAAWKGNAEVIPVLIKAGADVHAKNNDGNTPLHSAAFWGKAEVIPVLIKAGADVNAKNNHGDTPLHAMARTGRAEVISILLQARADVNAKNVLGDTPLDCAKTANHWNAAKLLEDAMRQQSRQREKPPERNEMPSDSAAARKFLELPPDIKLTSEHIKFAFRRARQRHHPDKGGAAEDFIRAKWAYDILAKK